MKRSCVLAPGLWFWVKATVPGLPAPLAPRLNDAPGWYEFQREAGELHATRFLRDEPSKLWHYSSMTKLKAADIKSALATVPEWRRTGAVISHTYQFKDFVGAMKFVNRVA